MPIPLSAPYFPGCRTGVQDSEAQLRAVVEDQTELICRYDADFRLTFSNRAHARLFGVEPETLLGQDLFSPLPAELRAPLRAELLGLTIEHPIRTGENQKVLSTGEVRWFAWTTGLFSILPDSGSVISRLAATSPRPSAPSCCCKRRRPSWR